MAKTKRPVFSAPSKRTLLKEKKIISPMLIVSKAKQYQQKSGLTTRFGGKATTAAWLRKTFQIQPLADTAAELD